MYGFRTCETGCNRHCHCRRRAHPWVTGQTCFRPDPLAPSPAVVRWAMQSCSRRASPSRVLRTASASLRFPRLRSASLRDASRSLRDASRSLRDAPRSLRDASRSLRDASRWLRDDQRIHVTRGWPALFEASTQSLPQEPASRRGKRDMWGLGCAQSPSRVRCPRRAAFGTAPAHPVQGASPTARVCLTRRLR
jgi:hypothetical protein